MDLALPLEQLQARLASRARHFFSDHPQIVFAGELAATLLIFLLLTNILKRVTILPEAAYFDWSIAWGLAAHLHPAVLLGGITALTALIRYGALADRWDAFEHGTILRASIMVLAVALAWPYVTYDYNHYLDQSHALDRALLVTLTALISWRPAFIIPFLPLQMAIMWQFLQPTLGGSLFAHKLQLVYPLVLFASALCLHAISRRFPMRAFMLLMITMVGATYWEAARAKHVLDWTFTNELHLILPAAFNHGWLGAWSDETIATLSRAVGLVEWLLQPAVIILEAACILIATSRRFAITLLGCLIVFHVGVFAFYGFLFWTWITLDVVLILLLIRLRPDIFGLRMTLISAPLVLFGTYWAHAPSLGWLDTRVGYTYRLEAIFQDAGRTTLDPAYFAPYQDAFTMTGFSYLSENVLTGPYAVTHDPELAVKLRKQLSIDQVAELERTAPVTLDPVRRARFAEFVRTFVKNRNRNGETWTFTTFLEAPGQFHTTGSRGASEVENIKEVIVIEVTSIARDNEPHSAREREVLRIPIGNSAP